MPKKKATYSKKLGKEVKRAGSSDAFRSRMGYLPSGYHQSPKKFAKTLNSKQKARIRKMHKSISATSFNRIYGFPKGKK